MSAPPVFDSFLWPCFTEISHGQTFENPREFSYSLPSFSFSNLGKFRGLLSSILKPSRCPRSRKFSKFENENENFRGLRFRLASLIDVFKSWIYQNVQYLLSALFFGNEILFFLCSFFVYSSYQMHCKWLHLGYYLLAVL